MGACAPPPHPASPRAASPKGARWGGVSVLNFVVRSRETGRLPLLEARPSLLGGRLFMLGVRPRLLTGRLLVLSGRRRLLTGRLLVLSGRRRLLTSRLLPLTVGALTAASRRDDIIPVGYPSGLKQGALCQISKGRPYAAFIL
jgi:hypothetical protein